MIAEGENGLLFVQASKANGLKEKGVDSRFEVSLRVTEDFHVWRIERSGQSASSLS